MVVFAAIFIGPKDIPVVVRAIVRFIHQVKEVMAEIRAAFTEVAREAGVDDIRGDMQREVRRITGDDGEEYEAYDIEDFLDVPPPKRIETDDAS